jgi:hypothetical protein
LPLFTVSLDLLIWKKVVACKKPMFLPILFFSTVPPVIKWSSAKIEFKGTVAQELKGMFFNHLPNFKATACLNCAGWQKT